MKEVIIANGYEPIGWYMESSYNLDVYTPYTWNYYKWRSNGKSNLKSAKASNGKNTFEILSLDPEDPSSVSDHGWKFGFDGTLPYKVNPARGNKTVKIPFELSVYMKVR